MNYEHIHINQSCFQFLFPCGFIFFQICEQESRISYGQEKGSWMFIHNRRKRARLIARKLYVMLRIRFAPTNANVERQSVCVCVFSMCFLSLHIHNCYVSFLVLSILILFLNIKRTSGNLIGFNFSINNHTCKGIEAKILRDNTSKST